MGDQKTYKIGVVQDPDDPTFNANNEDLKEIPTDWSIKTRVAKEVIYEYIERGNELDAMDHNYRVKKWLMFLCCSLSSIIGVFLIFMAIGYTVLFSNFPFNQKILIVGCVCFFPCFVWFVYVFCPCGQLYRDRVAIMDRRAKRNLENRKRDAHINNREFLEKIDDEFVYVDNGETKLTDRFKAYSDLRGYPIDYSHKFEMANGYTNDYYYKYFLFGHNEIMRKLRNKKLYALDYPEPTYDVFKEIEDSKIGTATIQVPPVGSGRGGGDGGDIEMGGLHRDFIATTRNNKAGNVYESNVAAFEGAKTLEFVDHTKYSNIDVAIYKEEKKEEVAVKEKKIKVKKLAKAAPTRRDPNVRPKMIIDARNVSLQPPEWEVSGGLGKGSLF